MSVDIAPLPRFTLNAFASFVDALRLAADERDRSRPIQCAWTVMSETGQPIQASCGVEVSAQTRFQDPRAFDYVMVVGGLLKHDMAADAAVARQQLQRTDRNAGFFIIFDRARVIGHQVFRGHLFWLGTGKGTKGCLKRIASFGDCLGLKTRRDQNIFEN